MGLRWSEAGYFPFYIGLISPRQRGQFHRRAAGRSGESFVGISSMILSVMIPTVIYVG
jgi:hypothetical protein